MIANGVFQIEPTRTIGLNHGMVRPAIDTHLGRVIRDIGRQPEKKACTMITEMGVFHLGELRGQTKRSLWEWMRRGAAVGPGIGHLKAEHCLNRNRLWGKEGDMGNVILSVAGISFRKLLKHLRAFWHRVFEKTDYLLIRKLSLSVRSNPAFWAQTPFFRIG